MDDLSSSASTGNVAASPATHEFSQHHTGSLRSIQSDDSIVFDKSSFLPKNQSGLAMLSPLVATSTTTPTHTQAAEEATSDGSDTPPPPPPSLPPSYPVGRDTESPVVEDSYEQQAMIKGPIKPRQLDVIRRVSSKTKNSPISSFVLDSSLLDVSYAK